MRFLAFLFFAAFLLTLSGCASTEPQDPDRVSNIPWNRPEMWEGLGALGGFNPGGGGN